jgi:hypothetical protein
MSHVAQAVLKQKAMMMCHQSMHGASSMMRVEKAPEIYSRHLGNVLGLC